MKVCPSCHSRFVGGETFCPHDGTKLVEARELSPGELTGSELDDVVKLDKLIASDPFAERYRGRLLDNRRSVYVTVFNQRFIVDNDATKRVETARAKVEAPLPVEINTLLQVHLEKNPAYIIESEPRGPSIRELLTERKELPWTDAVRITANLARAAQWLHENGVPHWAFHADSVFVTKLASGRVCVGDWALEAVLPADSVERKLEEDPSTFAGYVDYMAPELATGTERADIRSAVYALGCLLYEMVLGRPPLPADTATEVLKRHKHEKPVRLSIAKGGADLHDELDDILDMMLAKDPEKRFQVPIAVVAALSNLVDQSPDELAPPLERAPVEEEDDLYRTIDMDSVDREDVMRSAEEAPDLTSTTEDIPSLKIGAVSGTSATQDEATQDEVTAEDVPLGTETKRLKSMKDITSKDLEVDAPSRPTLLGNLGNLKKPASSQADADDSERKTLNLGSRQPEASADEISEAERLAMQAISEAEEDDPSMKETIPADSGFSRAASKSGILKGKKIGKIPKPGSSSEATDDADPKTDEVPAPEPITKETNAAETAAADAPSPEEVAGRSPDDSLDGDPDKPQLLRRSDLSREFDTVSPNAPPSDKTAQVTVGKKQLDADREAASARGKSAAASDSGSHIKLDPDEAKRAGLTAGTPNTNYVQARDNTREIDRSDWFANANEDAWDEALARDYAESSEKTNRTIKIGLIVLLAVSAIGAIVYFEFVYSPSDDPAAVADGATADEPDEPAVDISEIRGAFDDALGGGRIVSPAGNSALHFLEELKRHAADQPTYEEAREAFVAAARQKATEADAAGDLRAARALAGYASQFAPEDAELAAMVDDLQARFTGEKSGNIAAAADAGSPVDAGEPDMGADLGTPTEEPPTPEKSEPEPVAQVTQKTPPKKSEPPKKTTPPKKAPKNNPDALFDALKDEARAAHTRGDLNEARKLYHDALDIKANDAVTLAGLGKVYFDQANYREAAKYQTRAVRYAPGRNDYRISLGQSFYRLKKYDTAIGVWKKVLERDPSNSVAKQYIMLAERKLGN